MRRWIGLLACALVVDAQASLKIVSPVDGELVPTLSAGQKAFVTMPHDARVAFFADQKKRNEMQKLGWYPPPVKLAWEGGAAGTTYTVSVKRLPDGKVFGTWEGAESSCVVDNLEIARTYEWSVSGSGETVKGTFKTEDIAPRLLRVDGASNMRDLGGRIGLGGKRVKQGMVYRTAGLNSNASEAFYSKEELKEKGLYAQIEADRTKTEKQLVRWKSAVANPSTVNVLKSPLAVDWTLQFKDGSIENVKMDKRGQVFTQTKTTDDVTLTQRFTASDEGVFLASMTLSQLATIRVNGEIVHDLKNTSSSHHRPTKDDAVVALPVKKGANEIVVTVNPRGSLRVWRLTASPKEPLTKALASMQRNAENRKKYGGRVAKGLVPGKNRLNAASQAYLTQTLGIRSDIDLRSDRECFGMTGSPMGPSVTWFHYSSSAYGGMQSESGKAAFKKVFAVFLDEKNYPIDFHCIAGQDRTGAVAYILNGLLGVDPEQLSLDWEVTGFWNKDAGFNHEKRYNGLVRGFAPWPGKTVCEKLENYVLSLGFTKADIARFRVLMLED